MYESLGDLDARIQKPGSHLCFKKVFDLTKFRLFVLPNDRRSWLRSEDPDVVPTFLAVLLHCG